MAERISTTVTRPVKVGIRNLMEPLGLSESAVAAKLLEDGVKRWTPRVRPPAKQAKPYPIRRDE